MPSGQKPIDNQIAEYLIFQIEGSNELNATIALQELCTLYRRGYRLNYEAKLRVETVVIGRLNARMHEVKSRRWCLNTLALIGTSQGSATSIMAVIDRYQSDPDTLLAAISAYFHVEKHAYRYVLDKNITSHETVILAAINGGYIDRIATSTVRIDLDASGNWP